MGTTGGKRSSRFHRTKRKTTARPKQKRSGRYRQLGVDGDGFAVGVSVCYAYVTSCQTKGFGTDGSQLFVSVRPGREWLKRELNERAPDR